jgi:hypothetical protein
LRKKPGQETLAGANFYEIIPPFGVKRWGGNGLALEQPQQVFERWRGQVQFFLQYFMHGGA